MRRRAFIAASVATPPALALSTKLATAGEPIDDVYGPLATSPDALGILLPHGFTSRLVATSGEVVAGTDYVWHTFPDGGACFATEDGGWIYVSNSEVGPGSSGVGAVVFDSEANIIDAYSLLTGSARNCGGGATPWGTWLSGEEVEQGKVFECDPTGTKEAVDLPSLGRFIHEAVCIDTDREQVYLTEDAPDGGLYRFTPDAYPDLSAGLLEVAAVTDGVVTWHAVPDPLATTTATRAQVAEHFSFNGGEGIYYREGIIWFVTKGDHGVWKLDATNNTIEQIYNGVEADNGVLGEPDNVVITAFGDVLICEDQGSDQQVVLVTPEGAMAPLMQLVGQDGSELAGVAMNPAGDRMYVSSQRGGGGGLTYEISGPFRKFVEAPTTTVAPNVTKQTSAIAGAMVDEDDPPAFLFVGVGGALVAAIGYGVYKLRNRNDAAS